MAKYVIEDTTLTSIADAIRTKTGTTDTYTPTDMATAIEGIEVGSKNTLAGTPAHGSSCEFMLGWWPVYSVYDRL